MADKEKLAEFRSFHEFRDDDTHEHGVVYSDHEDEYEPTEDAEDLPDLFRYLEALDTADTDLDGPHKPPGLFTQPEHKHNFNNIQLLKYEVEEEKVHEYVDEFETGVEEDVLVVGKISLEEIQEEEKRLRDEHIAFQQQELDREKFRRQELFKVEEEAKRRVAQELKALTCYDCDVITVNDEYVSGDKRCMNPSSFIGFFNPPPTTECPSGCGKEVARAVTGQLVSRGCVPVICLNFGTDVFGGLAGAHSYCCKENKCNGAETLYSSIPGVVLATLLLFALI